LLASLLLVVLVLSAIGFVYTASVNLPEKWVSVLMQGIVAVGMLLLYIVSRTQYHRVAAWIAIGILATVPFAVAFFQQGGGASSVLDAFVWAFLPILLSSVLLPLWGVMVLAVINVLGLVLLPMLVSQRRFEHVVLSLGFVAVLSGLVIALTRYRDRLERDRQSVLEESNRELQAIRASLEERVAQRTGDLERRARYLQATSSVGREAQSLLGDPEALLSRVVGLISELFGFYHAGLFLIDPQGQWAELQAASSEGGQRMLARNHRLQVGAQGIVGTVAARGEPRIALDVDEDAAFLANPDLPDTRSEMALPLRARGEIVGVLDAQSTEPGAFSEEDVSVMQSLADQVAMAIDNARLFEQAEAGAEAERRARGELSREAWRQLLQTESGLGYLGNQQGIYPAGDVWLPEMEEAASRSRTTVSRDDGMRLAVPVRIAGQVVGVLDGRKRGDAGSWAPEERAALEVLAEQLSAALERARLYEDTQRSAARERVIGQVTGRMREPLELDDVLRTAVDEIQQALGLEKVVIRVAIGETDDGLG
jgi:GAF domain-containing protein